MTTSNGEQPSPGKHSAAYNDDGPILEVTDLNVAFFVDGEWFPAAIDVTYHVDAGEVLAIVGESGSGKTQSSMSLLGLLPVNGRSSGSAKLKGQELVGLAGAGLRRIRGKEIAVIFQEPMTAMNPVYTIGFQIVETHPLALRPLAQGGQGPRHRAAQAGGDPRAGAPLRRVPAPALGWAAPAGDDRAGTGLRAAAAGRRRADHGARRDRAGRDPQADARPARAGQRRDRADHPRHGRGGRHGRPHRGDAAGTHRRVGHRRPDLQQPPARVHQAAAGRRTPLRCGQRVRDDHRGVGHDGDSAGRRSPTTPTPSTPWWPRTSCWSTPSAATSRSSVPSTGSR